VTFAVLVPEEGYRSAACPPLSVFGEMSSRRGVGTARTNQLGCLYPGGQSKREADQVGSSGGSSVSQGCGTISAIDGSERGARNVMSERHDPRMERGRVTAGGA